MSNAANAASTAGTKFSQAAKAASDDPATKLIAEGLKSLAEAIRDLDHELAFIKSRVN